MAQGGGAATIAPPQPDVEPRTTPARADLPEGIYIIFDASGSMLARLPDKTPRIDAAKRVLREFMNGDFSGQEVALRAYGHRRKEDCTDTELLVPFGPPAAVADAAGGQVADLKALGRTPITLSLREALKDFGERRGEIILITDGIESCDADPCALVREWREKNVNIRVHVVGFGLDEKSKQTLKCISDAAGTEYHDAQSARELAESLSKIQRQAASGGFQLQGADEAGQRLKVFGTLSRGGVEAYRVESHRGFKVEAGEYDLVAGVKTADGNLYKPVAQRVRVAETGGTLVRVVVPVPPRVRAKFMDGGEPQQGSLVSAFRGGQRVFQFRWFDEVYVGEGTYEFRARPDATGDLSVTETFAAGDRKEIVFRLAHTVKVTAQMVASGSGILFRENLELWQNGEQKHLVPRMGGVRVLPGTYDLRLPNALTPYVREGVVVTAQAAQHFDVVVPVGHVTVVYEKADGTRDKDDRCFMGRASGNSRVFKNSGQKYPLTPGTYKVTGWDQKGKYDPVIFEITEGTDRVIVLRAK